MMISFSPGTYLSAIRILGDAVRLRRWWWRSLYAYFVYFDIYLFLVSTSGLLLTSSRNKLEPLSYPWLIRWLMSLVTCSSPYSTSKMKVQFHQKLSKWPWNYFQFYLSGRAFFNFIPNKHFHRNRKGGDMNGPCRNFLYNKGFEHHFLHSPFYGFSNAELWSTFPTAWSTTNWITLIPAKSQPDSVLCAASPSSLLKASSEIGVMSSIWSHMVYLVREDNADDIQCTLEAGGCSDTGLSARISKVSSLFFIRCGVDMWHKAI